MEGYQKNIYVQKEQEGTEDEYLIASEKVEEVEDGKVAIYELKEIKTKSTVVEIK